MRREKKPISRWIGEAILIFLSVFGAFYFDNLREERNQKSIYIRHLKDFKLDLEENQGKFNHELNSRYVEETGQGYMNYNIRKYDFLDSIMTIPNRTNADTLMAIISDGGIYGFTKWIFTSPQYNKLSSEFYSYIQNDQLKFRIQMHYRNNESRTNLKESINTYVREYEGIQDQLNLNVGGTPSNRVILFSNPSINKIKRIKTAYESLRDQTQNTKTSDSLLIIQVDEELRLWGESIN